MLKTAFCLVVALMLIACSTISRMELPTEVLNTSTADETLRYDLITGIGGVGFLDNAFFPEGKKRKLTRIEVLTPYDNVKTGEERWFITDENGRERSYLVTLIPDGRGGTTFKVEKEGGTE